LLGRHRQVRIQDHQHVAARGIERGEYGIAFALVRFGTPGSPDIIVVHVGRPYFLEVKRPGTYQSADQKEFQESSEKAGAYYAVVRSIEDVQQLGL
jgi:hypothetical protein